LYAACLAGDVTEQLWNFTWPAAIATLHPSLLPVAVLGFFSKVRHAMLCLSRLPHSHSLLRPETLTLSLSLSCVRMQLVVFAAAPLVGDVVSSLPRIPAYRSLTVIQTAAHLVSAAMVTYAFTVPPTSSASALLLQPWFAALVASTAVDRLSCVSLGVITERDFVVQVLTRHCHCQRDVPTWRTDFRS
jgi:iron-regulated transporter 1